MLHTAGLLMSWLTGKRAHILAISLSLFSHSRLSHLLALLFPVSLLYCVRYMKIHILFLYTFCSPHFFFFLHSNCLLPCSNPASFSDPLLSLLFPFSLPLFCLILPLSLLLSSSLPLLFCAMPQGPPGPQGSPHPQPPPPNSMMGPHSQVTLPLPLSLFFSVFCYLRSFGNADSQCWCFMLWHSSQLNALCCF